MSTRKPIKLIFDDGGEIDYVSCPYCRCPRSMDHKCSGCEAKFYRDAAKDIESKMDDLKRALISWTR